jgi:hypothetical protein
MAISVFPAAVTSSLNASAITATTANTMYAASLTLEPGIYTITCASGTVTNVELYSGVGTLVTSTATVSGTITINLASSVDRIRLWTDTGSSVVVTFTKTAAALTNNFSGTLDTITTLGTSTYTGTSTSGYGYAILSGGGGGGGGGTGGSGGGSAGGSSGIAEKLVQLTGSLTVVIGAAGTAGAASTAGGTGGQSTFGGMTANGGVGGATNGTQSPGGGGSATGGTYNTTGNGGGNGGNGYLGGIGGSTPATNYKFVANNIGTGGNGGSSSGGQPGQTGTGYGAGGGGGGGNNPASVGGAGRQGVLYVLRF